MRDIQDIMRRGPVIPVVVLADAERAVDLARALVDGGVDVIEITRRTPAAPAALAAIKKAVPEICLGMGTVWLPEHVREAVDLGAEFIVSPGINDAVGDACIEADVAYLPGAQTVSEIAHHARRGMSATKLFPAGVIGGAPAIKAFSDVFPDLSFCPTGGVSADNAADYLSLPQVTCVGGSWLTPADAIEAGDWDTIRERAAQAARLGQNP